MPSLAVKPSTPDLAVLASLPAIISDLMGRSNLCLPNVAAEAQRLPLLCLDGDAGRAADRAVRVTELDEDAVGVGHKRYLAAGRREDGESRGRVGVYGGRDARAD